MAKVTGKCFKCVINIFVVLWGKISGYQLLEINRTHEKSIKDIWFLSWVDDMLRTVP